VSLRLSREQLDAIAKRYSEDKEVLALVEEVYTRRDADRAAVDRASMRTNGAWTRGVRRRK
jgi:hypothetical protein